MRLLLDECLDWRLLYDLPGHEVKTVQEMHWAGIKNGELLALAEREFQVFITGDLNLSFQQNVFSLSLAVVVLKAQSIRLIHTRPLMPQLLARLPSLTPGQVLVLTS